MGCHQSTPTTNTSAAATMSETPTTEKVKVATVDPAAVLNATSIAKTLTISDQHATILFTTKTACNGDGGESAVCNTLTLFQCREVECRTRLFYWF